LIDTDELDVSP